MHSQFSVCEEAYNEVRDIVDNIQCAVPSYITKYKFGTWYLKVDGDIKTSFIHVFQ